MKILFLIIGSVSFNSSSFVRNFIKQLETEEHDINIMAEDYTFYYLDQEKKNIKFISLTENFNDKTWSDISTNLKPDLVVISNLELLLFDESKVTFKKKYFVDIKSRVMFLVNNNIVTYKPKSAYLTSSPKEELKFSFPVTLLKSCPPYLPDDDDNEVTTFYWKNLEPFAFIAKEEERMHLKEYIKAKDDEKIVTVLLNLEQVITAVNKGLYYHYKILLELLISYFAKLETNTRLLIGNLAAINLETSAPNVKITFFGPLKDDFHDRILKSSDLIITESISGVSMIEAANLKTPVINLKSTLMLEKTNDEEGNEVNDIIFNFDEITDNVREKLKDLFINCPDSIFPYYSFPSVASINFDETKVFGHYIFTFSELFDEKATTNLLNELLLNDEARKEEIYRIEQYLALRADSLEAYEIIEKLS